MLEFTISAMGNLLGPPATPARGCPLFWGRGCALWLIRKGFPQCLDHQRPHVEDHARPLSSNLQWLQ